MKHPHNASSFEVTARLHHVVNALASDLPEPRIQSIRQLVDAGERTVALENLAQNLYDADALVPRELLAELLALAAELGAQGPFELLRSSPP